MTTPAVSVIIPTCNRANLLPSAIGSVLDQTFPYFELLVIDDASDLAIDDVVDAFHDKRIRLIRHNSRRGGAAARNTGIKNSQGEFVAFLDDDDEWYPAKLARQMEVMARAQSEVAVVYTGYLVIDRVSGVVRGQMIPSQRGNLHEKLLAGNPIGGTSSILLKRSCLEKVGLFDETLPSFQDRDLWIRISREFHFDYVQEPLLNYFLHSEKVWTNLEALTRGLEIMLQKYDAFPAFRKQSSRRYLEFGIRFCDASEIQQGRSALLKSIRLQPYQFRSYLYLMLSLFGPRMFTLTREKKANISARLGLPSFSR